MIYFFFRAGVAYFTRKGILYIDDIHATRICEEINHRYTFFSVKNEKLNCSCFENGN